MRLCDATPDYMLFHRIGRLFKGRPSLLVSLVSILSLHLSLLFYFWHDDFSVFYGPQIGECSFKWPYQSYCTTYTLLLKVFGYHPFPYFLLGLLVSIGAAILFYKLLLEIFPQKVALLSACLFASSYFGIGTFFESYDSLFSFASLALLFSSMLFTLRRRFVIGLILLGAAVGFFQARSGTYLIPFLAILWLYARVSLKKKVLLSFLAAIVFYIAFIPGSSFGSSGGSFFTELTKINYLDKVVYFFQSVSSFFLIDSLFPKLGNDRRLAAGIILCIAFCASILYDIYEHRSFKAKLLGVVLFVALYIPFGLRSDWRLDSLHRYTLFVAPAVFIIWASFGTKRYWIPVTLALLVVQIYLANMLLTIQLADSNVRKSFYSQLHSSLEAIPTNSYLYFYFPQKIRSKYSDIFRVGYLPSESSIATEYQLNFKDITLATESEQMSRFIRNGTSPDNLFVFYFKDAKLINNTTKARAFIKNNVRKSYQSDIRFSTSFEQIGTSWEAKSSSNSFEVENDIPSLPFTLTASIASKIPLIPVPFTQNCMNCKQDNKLFTQISEYDTKAKDTKKLAQITTSASGENTESPAMFDGNVETYWMANRQLWHGERDVYINVHNPKAVALDGIVLSSISDSRVPNNLKVLVNGTEVKFTSQLAQGSIKISFDKTQVVSDLQIKILDTVLGDSPIITEIYLVPQSLLGLDLVAVENMKMSPPINVQSPEDRDAAMLFMKTSGEGCLTIETSDEKVSVPFELISDGRVHKYSLAIPSMGRGPLKVSLGCMQFPIDAVVSQLDISL